MYKDYYKSKFSNRLVMYQSWKFQCTSNHLFILLSSWWTLAC